MQSVSCYSFVFALSRSELQWHLVRFMLGWMQLVTSRHPATMMAVDVFCSCCILNNNSNYYYSLTSNKDYVACVIKTHMRLSGVRLKHSFCLHRLFLQTIVPFVVVGEVLHDMMALVGAAALEPM